VDGGILQLWGPGGGRHSGGGGGMMGETREDLELTRADCRADFGLASIVRGVNSDLVSDILQGGLHQRSSREVVKSRGSRTSFLLVWL